MRIALALVALALVSACNSVTSTKPLFFERDAEGQPQLRPGIWTDEATGCDVDTRLPMDQWPGLHRRLGRAPGRAARRPRGNPALAVDSLSVRPGAGRSGGDAGRGGGGGDPPSESRLGYVYAGVRPLKYDAQGRIVEYKMWPALCGPPPPPDPTGEKSAVMTEAPIEGLVMDKDQQDCVASDQGPVRVSVQKSEHWGDGGDSQGRDHAHWIRDGER